MKKIEQYQRYAWVYKSYNALKGFVFNVNYIIGLGFIAACSGVFLLCGQDAAKFGLGGSLIVLVACLILLLVFFLVINGLMKSSGGQYIYSIDSCFKRADDSGNKRFRIDIKDVDSSYFYFPAKEKDFERQLNLTVELHRDAFLNTPWGADVEKRNRQHLKANDLCLMLMRPVGNNLPWAFTHVAAVSKNVWDEYSRGQIADKSLLAERIVHHPVSSTEKPYGLIILAVSLSENKALFTKGTLPTTIEQFLVGGLAYHIKQYLEREFARKSYVPVMFQTMRWNVIRTFKGFMKSSHRQSKEGARIICFELSNTWMKDDRKSNVPYETYPPPDAEF